MNFLSTVTGKTIGSLLLAGLLTVLSGCIRLPGEYHHYQLLPKQTWAKQDTIFFDDSLSISSEQIVNPGALHLAVCLRHNTLYPYENLNLIVKTSIGASAQSDTVDICLVDSRHRWRGKGWGSSYYIDQSICQIDRTAIYDYVQSERDSLYDEYAHLPIEIYGRPEGANDSKGISQIPFKIQIISGMMDSYLRGMEGIGIHLY